MYTTFGKIDRVGPRIREVHNPIRMQGQYEDEETGLYYNRYRYFDPHICAYISQDPLGLLAGENVYCYPINTFVWCDPLGLACKKAESGGVRTKSQSEGARSWQGKGDYPGVDNWSDTTLKKGTTVWGGAPGQSNFYTTNGVMKNVKTDATVFVNPKVHHLSIEKYTTLSKKIIAPSATFQFL